MAQDSEDKGIWPKFFQWMARAFKVTAVGTTVAGAVTVVAGKSAVTGLAVSALGASGYIAGRGIPTRGYERITHVPPVSRRSLVEPQPARSLQKSMDGVSPSDPSGLKPLTTPQRSSSASRYADFIKR